MYVISDDIHCDLILPGQTYVPAMTVPTLKDYVITLISATKTFNIAGLQASSCIIPDKKLRNAIYKRLQRYGHWEPNIFGIVAQQAAYENCKTWPDALMCVIEDNMDYMLGILANTPLKSFKPEATYLLWVDCASLSMTNHQMMDFFIDDCKICPAWGKPFGAPSFIRLNMAAPKSVIIQIAQNIVMGLKKAGYSS